MLFFETAFLLLYSCKQHVLLWQQQIFRTSNLVCSKQQSVLIISYKQLELVNYKLKISSLSTLMLIEQYIFLLSHSIIYSVHAKQWRSVIDCIKTPCTYFIGCEHLLHRKWRCQRHLQVQYFERKTDQSTEQERLISNTSSSSKIMFI